ncbi:hypothetical protein HELRODRAFT_181789 [Helobdella robusta]|uniref:MORN repeat-containing protein 5 n=1 Tax=Helobdella robusta TaxID=6412 RepID=T1FHB9_HELRO|nr:hypothetical protein HELRODRAFT_181789 [Helobdella robusta]ESN92165.1 hypothetical protein HELRODRAFT_181789 [Helobdella robusta]
MQFDYIRSGNNNNHNINNNNNNNNNSNNNTNNSNNNNKNKDNDDGGNDVIFKSCVISLLSIIISPLFSHFTFSLLIFFLFSSAHFDGDVRLDVINVLSLIIIPLLPSIIISLLLPVLIIIISSSSSSLERSDDENILTLISNQSSAVSSLKNRPFLSPRRSLVAPFRSLTNSSLVSQEEQFDTASDITDTTSVTMANNQNTIKFVPTFSGIFSIPTSSNVSNTDELLDIPTESFQDRNVSSVGTECFSPKIEKYLSLTSFVPDKMEQVSLMKEMTPPHGSIKYQLGNGETFKGHFIDGKKNGVGKYSYNDGSIYSGEWHNDVKCGRGLLVYVDGRRSDQYAIESDHSDTGSNQTSLTITLPGLYNGVIMRNTRPYQEMKRKQKSGQPPAMEPNIKNTEPIQPDLLELNTDDTLRKYLEKYHQYHPTHKNDAKQSKQGATILTKKELLNLNETDLYKWMNNEKKFLMNKNYCNDLSTNRSPTDISSNTPTNLTVEQLDGTALAGLVIGCGGVSSCEDRKIAKMQLDDLNKMFKKLKAVKKFNYKLAELEMAQRKELDELNEKQRREKLELANEMELEKSKLLRNMNHPISKRVLSNATNTTANSSSNNTEKSRGSSGSGKSRSSGLESLSQTSDVDEKSKTPKESSKIRKSKSPSRYSGTSLSPSSSSSSSSSSSGVASLKSSSKARQLSSSNVPPSKDPPTPQKRSSTKNSKLVTSSLVPSMRTAATNSPDVMVVTEKVTTTSNSKVSNCTKGQQCSSVGAGVRIVTKFSSPVKIK